MFSVEAVKRALKEAAETVLYAFAVIASAAAGFLWFLWLAIEPITRYIP